jgi:hypothetical protein
MATVSVRRSGPRLVHVLLASAILTTSGLLAAEVVCRRLGFSKTWASYGTPDASGMRIDTRFERLGFRRVPGVRTAWARGVFARTNSLGYRDEEFDLHKDPGTTRIAFVGDSVTEGFGVNVQRRFADLVAKRLDAASNSRHFDSYVFAIAGHATVDHYFTLDNHAMRHAPDLVIV